ncbi:MAG: TlpA family protein disulfide reductase [Bacteroidales bacterium]|nr:TlpA family protein disulfide reductase [Bacteroidales bacterium]
MMMQRILTLLLLMFFLPLLHQSKAQQITISGQAPSFANTEIVFYRTADWISGTEEVAGQCQVSDSGYFEISVPVETTGQLYAYLGVYRAYFFVEPGKTYQLVLPERKDKSPESQLNPYFEPVEIHLGLANFSSDELNILIMMLNDAFIPYYDKHVNDVYLKPDLQKLEDDITRMEEPFSKFGNSFFKEYRRYHYGILKMLANQQRVQSISDEYFNNHPVLYANPSYADLFNQVYDKYFTFLGRSGTGQQIYKDINETGSLKALLKTLSESNHFSNDTLKELVILKQLHDEFYGSQFSRSALLRILDSLTVTSHIEEHKRISGIIKGKITRLLPGYEPPSFELLDTEGNIFKLSDFKGRYVYLNFCTCQSYACLNEFNMLADLHKRHKDRLTIITIATDPMEEVLRQFLIKNQYAWKFLHFDNQPEILKEYDIRAFPTYFLIGPDGRLIFSPALSPAENFEQKLFDTMRGRGDL